MILAHDVRGQSAGCSTLASHRVHKNALSSFNGLLYEIKDGITCFILAIEDHLVILIQPEERQIRDSNRLPVIRNLLARTINDMRNFISHHKLDVLRRQLVSDE